MSTLKPPAQPTGKLAGGNSRKTGNMNFGGATRTRKTGANTTSGNKTIDLNYFMVDGINVRPKPLMMKHVEKQEVRDENEEPQSHDQSRGESNLELKASAEVDKKKETGSQHSQMTSSMVETSEDEREKKRLEDEKKKSKKKGISETELDIVINVEIKETKTITLLHIPGICVNHDTEEAAQTMAKNKGYEALKQSKIGSDSFTVRGTQTLNLSQKSKNEVFYGFAQENKEATASNWDIDDASKGVKMSEAKQQELNYLKSVDDIMTAKLKKPGNLFNAEELASHISIMDSQTTDPNKKSGTNSNQSKKGVSKGASQSGINQSKGSESQSSASGIGASKGGPSTSMPTETQGGDYGNIKAKDVEYINEELPDSIMKAIRIIERLLTQSKYHEQHVAYKNYPPVDIERPVEEEEENKEDANAMMMFGGGAKKEEEEKKNETEVVQDNEEETSMKSLFKFECDITEGRQVSSIDINSVNADLIAVSYGEYDIDSTNELKPGILAFWTLKNPTFPEKIIYWDNSITCCQFSKKQPHLIAIGDSQGNIAIFNIRSDDLSPIADSKDLDGKHTDIIWEIKWVDRDSKGEALVSISGDGRVVEWSMKKGLELTDLTQLKRETNPNQKDVFQSAAADDKEKKAGMTFINTGGMSVDFPIKENGITYYAATEDCSIHMCQTSYPDQYIANFYGHTGPIYKVKCNPFWHPQDCPIFLTCSYDWTVRVWSAKEDQAQLVCHQIAGEVLRDQVNDIEWSPSTSSCFASVTNDGRVEVWDLKIDNLGPIITYFDEDEDGKRVHTPKTIVKFSPTAPVILTGNLNGQVDVYRTRGLEHVQVLVQDQQNRIMGALTKDDFASTEKEGSPEE